MIRQFDKDTWYDSDKDQFIFSESIALNGKPVSLTVHVSNACNSACHYCLSESEEKRPDALSANLLKRLEEISPFKAILAGGEPFILPNIEEVIGSLYDKGCSVYVSTNAIVIPVNLISRVDCFDVHLDGTNDEVYARSMGKDNFARVLDNLEKLVAYGAQVRLNCVVNKNNYENVFEFPDFCRDLGIKRLELIRLLPMGRAKGSGLFVSEDAMQKLRSEMSRHSDLQVHFMYSDYERTKNEWFKSYPVINSEGNLLALPEHRTTGTTVFDEEIKEVFNQYKQFLYDSPRSIIKK